MKDIFRSKKIIGFLLILPVILTGLIFYILIYKPDLNIISSSDKFKIFGYCDKEHSGGSMISSPIIAGNSIKFKYTLQDGYVYPYAGITIIPKHSSGNIDISEFDHLKIKIKATEGKSIPVYIGLYVPKFTDPSNSMSYKFMENILELNNRIKTYKVAFDGFRTPSWWYQVNRTSESSLVPSDFSKVHFINIQNCFFINKGVEDEIEIEELTFYKDYSIAYIYSSILLSLYYVVLGVVFVSKKRNKKKEVIIKYQKVETVDKAETEKEKIISFISMHYADTNLNLEVIQKETGVSELKISSILKDAFGMGFKQYLNKLRLEEAKRLLRETNLQVAEIAYKVGYGNISHFNRVFKESIGTSPNDFRKNTSAEV